MADYDAALHTDVDNKSTSAEWDDANSRWVQKVEVIGTSSGADPAIGDVDDAAVTDPATNASVISALKGLLTRFSTVTTGIFKAEDAASADGALGIPILAARRDTATSGVGTDGDWALLSVGSNGGLRTRLIGVPNVPDNVTPSAHSSGNVAAATATATLPAVSAKTTYISGFTVTGAGATAGSVILVTVTGLAAGTLTYVLVIPTGVTTEVRPLNVVFPTPLPGSAVNTAIVVSAPSFGAGNTNAAVTAHGFNV